MNNVIVNTNFRPTLAIIDISTADTMHLPDSVPFQPTFKCPNKESLDAMLELEDGKGRLFNSTESLFVNWRN